MRTREEIEKEIARLRGWSPADATAGCMELSIEVLLDIRELLASPMIHKDFGKLRDEVTGGVVTQYARGSGGSRPNKDSN